MLPRLQLTTIILVILVCLSLGACQIANPPLPTPTLSQTPVVSNTPTPAPTPTEVKVAGTVSIWHAWDMQKRPALLKAIHEFQSLYPDVIFDVQYVPQIDLKGAFEAASIDGDPPDIVIGDGQWGVEWFERGWVADLTGVIPERLLGSLNEAGVEAAHVGNSQVGLPISLEGVVLYRNRNLILASAETMDEMITFSRQVTQGDVFGAYLERSFYYSGGHLYGLGGRLMDAQGRPAFNDRYGLAWIELLRSFERFGLVDFYSDNDVQYFIANRAGYIIESTRLRNRLVETLGSGGVAIDPFPLLDQGNLAGFVQAENVYLSPQALNKAGGAAEKFVESLLSASSQAYLGETGSIPALKASAAFAPGSQFSIKDELIKQAMIALESGYAYPPQSLMTIYAPQMDIALQSIFVDGTPPDQALDRAEAAIREVLEAGQGSSP